eukprot:g6836.t1
MIGLPDDLYPKRLSGLILYDSDNICVRFVEQGSMKTKYAIIIGGQNFGCGSSREHAPVAIGAAGIYIYNSSLFDIFTTGSSAVIAESYARIFFRNCIATGELYPVESEQRLCEVLETDTEVELDLENSTLTVPATGQVYQLKPLGEVKPVVDAGGIFEFARREGLIKKH